MTDVKPLTKFLVSGKLVRAVEDWHDICATPSQMEGEVSEVSMDGVTLWGTVKGCPECDVWVWTTVSGEVREIDTLKE